MPYQDYYVLMGAGGLFLVLGLIAAIWGWKEEKGYYNALAARRGDAREFMDHWPPRPQPGALKTGGWIAIAVGVAMLVVGGIFGLLG